MQLPANTSPAIDVTNQVWCFNNIGLMGGCPQTFQPSVYTIPSGDVARADLTSRYQPMNFPARCRSDTRTYPSVTP